MDKDKTCDVNEGLEVKNAMLEETEKAEGKADQPEVIIYTSDTCGYCHAAKDYFNENGIKYTEKNVSQDVDARKELISKKIRGVPYILVGDEAIEGFNRDRLSELFGL